jgi:DNA repair protein RadD
MELRWYQRESINAAFSHLCLGADAGNPVIELPTGSGKSAVIGELCRSTVQDYASRVVVLAHRKELLEQNADKIRRIAPGVGVGVYSAGLKQRDTESDVLVAGIQSIYKRAHELGRRHLVLIDECHLVSDSDEGMFRDFLRDLGNINERLRVVGLTATPFRTGKGNIAKPDGLFRKIVYRVPIQRLIAEGFLCEITSDTAAASLDTSVLHVRGGEFISTEVEGLFDQADNVKAACREIVAKVAGRHSVMVFCSGVLHAEHVRDSLASLTGEAIGLVTGNTLPIERSATLANFKNGVLRWLVNVDVLTTGFDAPCVDAIAVLRATMSPGLFAQICGRGLRIDSSKTNCLILDFGENIKRHGPLDASDYGMKPKQERKPMEGGDGQPVKLCPGCNASNAPSAKTCSECELTFPFNHQTNAANDDILATPHWYEVIGVKYSRHKKKLKPDEGPKPDTLRVDYEVVSELGEEIVCSKCGTKAEVHRDFVEYEPEGSAHYARLLCASDQCQSFIRWLPRGFENKAKNGDIPRTISEWVCLEHPVGWTLTKARLWWMARTAAPFPEGVFEADEYGEEFCIKSPIDQALSLQARGGLATPRRIQAVRNQSKFFEIKQVDIEEIPETWGGEIASDSEEEAPF